MLDFPLTNEGREPTHQHGQREEVLSVMLEDPLEHRKILFPEVAKVELRDHGPGDIVIAFVAEQHGLEAPETEIRDQTPPKATGQGKKIQMGQRLAGPGAPGEDEAGFEQRQIEAPAVIGDKTRGFGEAAG
jgi:hypothetical protein